MENSERTLEKQLLERYQQVLYVEIFSKGVSSKPALDDFTQAFHKRHLKKKEVFVPIGESSHSVGFIIRGVMRAYYVTTDGKEYTKTIFTEKEFLAPLTAIVTGQNSLIGLQALTHVDLLVTRYRLLEELFAKHHQLEHMARKMIEFLWADKEKRELELVTLSAAERYEIFIKNRRDLLDRIPHHYIASCLGITPVALSRIRAKKAKR
ncbi:MAG: Crp/Fnr family transcriptional regulator [Spirochaetota bacterium]